MNVCTLIGKSSVVVLNCKGILTACKRKQCLYQNKFSDTSLSFFFPLSSYSSIRSLKFLGGDIFCGCKSLFFLTEPATLFWALNLFSSSIQVHLLHLKLIIRTHFQMIDFEGILDWVFTGVLFG